MNTSTQRGFLILADITGFTPFVADTELEHSNEILNDILKNIVSHLTPTFTLAEVEGDAVFVYAPDNKFQRGELIMDVIETSYASFRDRKNTFQRLRSCNCKACQMAPLLDLKFIVHYGEYILSSVSGKKKPLGSSVNVAHRLLKNSISEVMGWKAYMLLTKDYIDFIEINPTTFHRQTEQFDHLGAIETYSIDLDEQYRNALKNRIVHLSKEEADAVVERDFPIAPSLLWEWVNDPKQRTRWSLETDWNKGLRPLGRTGRGATNHCVNSKVMETILDYRPFDYYTSSMSRGWFKMTLTSEFKEIPSGTRLTWYLKLHSILPKRFSQFVCKLMVEKAMKLDKSFDKLSELIQRDTSDQEVLVS